MTLFRALAICISFSLCGAAPQACDNDAVCLATRGAQFGAAGRLTESSALFEQALRLNPDDWATRRNLASNQFQLGRLAEARQNLEIVRKQNPSDRTAILLLGMVAEELKDFPAAVRSLASVPDLVAQRPESIAALARAYYRTGAGEKARSLLLGSPKAGILGAGIAVDAGDFRTAHQLLASQPPSYEAASILYRANEFGRSETMLRNLLDRGVQTADVFNLLAWCRYKQGDVKEAVASMDLAIDRAPSAANHVDLGLMLVSTNRASVALEAAKQAVAADPKSYPAHMLKALAEARLNLLDAAAFSYRRAAALRPNAPEPVLALGVVLTASGRADEAEAAFEDGLRRYPRHAALYQEYGKFLAAEGHRARAANLFAKALSLDPNLPEPHYQLGRLALDDSKPAKALPHLERAAKLKTRSSAVHFALARAYRELDRPADSARELALFEKAREAEKRPAAAPVSRGGVPEVPEIPARQGAAVWLQ